MGTHPEQLDAGHHVLFFYSNTTRPAAIGPTGVLSTCTPPLDEWHLLDKHTAPGSSL